MYTSCGYLWRPEEVVRHPAARVTGNLEMPKVGSGNRTSILAKSSKPSELLGHLSSPLLLLS